MKNLIENLKKKIHFCVVFLQSNAVFELDVVLNEVVSRMYYSVYNTFFLVYFCEGIYWLAFLGTIKWSLKVHEIFKTLIRHPGTGIFCPKYRGMRPFLGPWDAEIRVPGIPSISQRASIKGGGWQLQPSTNFTKHTRTYLRSRRLIKILTSLTKILVSPLNTAYP